MAPLFDRFKRIVRAELSAARDRLGGAADDMKDRWTSGVRRAQSQAEQEGERRRGRSRSERRRARAEGQDDVLRRHYARLEVPYGSDMETTKAGYRKLMKRYHPDRHGTDADKSQVANEVAAALTESYEAIEAHLKARG